ncbi:MAG: choice-of-anchor Q domain-containing protein [Gemmataceae bacterium]
MNTWSQSVRKLLGVQLSRKSRRSSAAWRRKLELTPLEDRTVPATITVTSLADNVTVDGQVTLREAIKAAETNTSVDGSIPGSGADTIVFAPNLSGNIDLLLKDANTTFGPTGLVITTGVTIDGLANFTGANTIAIRRAEGAGNMRLFAVDAGGSLTLKGVTLSNGKAVGGDGGGTGSVSRGGGGGGAGLGGAVFVDALGALTVTQSTITGNSAIGGKGGVGAVGTGYTGGAGGGGLGGNGSNATGMATYGANAVGGSGGGPNPGTGGGVTAAGGNGGFGGGGGGGGTGYVTYYNGTYYYYPGGAGGNGGFGGGGGSRGYYAPGGGAGTSNGGFGGGGGFTNYGGGAGGFGGGSSSTTNSSGGGGAGMGGAIFSNGGPVTITNSTIFNNTAKGGDGGAANAGQGLGGGVFNRNGTLTILNSTISGNGGLNGGQNVFNLGDAGGTGTAIINNTIIGQANNAGSSTSTVTDFVSQTNGGSQASSGLGNLITNDPGGATGFGGTFITGDPNLTGLISNGGPTQVLSLNPGSPARDAGNNAAAAALTTDQRGTPFVRVFNTTVDIGAVEAQGAIVTSVTSTTADGTYGVGATINVTVNFSGPVTLAGGNLTITLDTGAVVTIGPFTNQSSVSGTYIVAAGQNSADLSSNSPLQLTGSATLLNSDGIDTTLTIPTGQSLANLKNIVIDTIAPTTTIGPPSAPLTTHGPITFLVTYTDANFNTSTLAPANITLNGTGTATGTISVSGTGNTRTVTISNITGDGTLGISISAGTATDTAGNPATAAGPSTTFEVDNTAPTITISPPSSTKASTGPNSYTVTYADKNFRLRHAQPCVDITLNKTGTANGTVSITGSGTTRTVTISNITGDGSLNISIAANTATDTAPREQGTGRGPERCHHGVEFLAPRGRRFRWHGPCRERQERADAHDVPAARRSWRVAIHGHCRSCHR